MRYRGQALAWEKGRQLKSYGGTAFSYDGYGRRIQKGGTRYVYDSGDNLVMQTDGVHTLEFYYNETGLAGLSHNGAQYICRKNVQGDIINLFDLQGNVVVKYVYDAWGNQSVERFAYTENGKQIAANDPAHIGNLNPFRYRSYYYDVETGLYYLKSRYYDPEVGRFINADDPVVCFTAQGNQVNGLNLYAYCMNNPVIYADTSGFSVFLMMLLIGILAGAAIGGTMNGISAYKDGQRGLGLFGAIAGGALMGGAMGATLVLGGAAGLSAAIAPIGLSVAGFGLSAGTALGISVGIGVGAGLVSYSLENGLRSNREWTFGDFAMAGISGGFKAASTFGIGYAGGKAGGFDKMILNPILKGANTISKSITYGMAKSILASVLQGTGRKILTKTAWYVGETMAKLLFVSSAASGVRWLIDKIFGT